ncbi:MAG: sulfatase-like hydrolase/transferase [Gammaproteobacteria bacterium]|nr:sulfatase-like hydrolase/transferase [Gammaproteobacteria bacterium]
MNTSDYLQTGKILFRWYLYLLMIFTVGRGFLFIYFFDRFNAADTNIWLTFLYGLRMDTMAACALLLFPALLLHTSHVFLARISHQLLRGYFLIVLLTALYMENATLPFINEYDVRPNVIFLNYLKYPREVLTTIWAVYKLELFIAFSMMSIAAYWFIHRTKTSFIPVLEIAMWKRLLVLIPVLLILVSGIRSSLGHRPANQSDSIFSSNRLLNEVAKNTIYSVGYAAYSATYHDGGTKHYGTMSQDEAFGRVARSLQIPYGDIKSPFRRIEKTHFLNKKPKNLVVLLEESLGAQFVGALGGREDITPNINALSKQSVFFKKLYSNGTRSIRGISGTVSGFLPLTGKGAVKRNLSQQNFFTIAQLLKPYGYKTSFFYGGESRFDNMKSWFSGNGFDAIYDEPTYDSSAFHGTWGVDDVSVVEAANAYYKQLFDNGENFVSVIFSTSNHTPFDFPPGKIELVENTTEKSVENAIKYADFAIGRFIELARRSGYYQDTVFLVIADHNIRVHGDDILPVDMFHIPGMILGGGIQPAEIDSLVTQPDAIATALDFVGTDFSYPILGKSIFSDTKGKIALMQFHDIYGLRRKDEVAVLQPDKPAATYTVTKDDHLILTEHNIELEKDALAFIVTLDLLYNQQLHR